MSCGREYLQVNGYIVASEIDKCRDINFGEYWNPKDFEQVLTTNPKIEPGVVYEA